MSVVNNNLLLTADAGVSQYQISRSLRFNSADLAYLNRTPSVAGNRQTWTWAGWAKRAGLGTSQQIFTATNFSPNNQFRIDFDASNALYIHTVDNGGINSNLITTAVYRDTSAWMHIVVAVNTTAATGTDRIKLYVNGIQITSFSTASYPSLNYNTHINTTIAHQIGYNLTFAVLPLSAYLADVHFIDGQALTPSSFTETNATTGQLVPKAYGGTYGTNGFRLNFSDNSAATLYTLGADSRTDGALNENNGTLTNGPTYSSANGGSIVFDGVNDYVINSSANNLPIGSSSRTVEIWFYPTTDTNPLVQIGGGGGQKYIVEFFNVSGTFYLFTDGINVENNITFSGSNLPTLNAWNHLVFGNSGQNWFYYLNGTLKLSGTFPVTLNTVTQKYIVGTRDDTGPPYNTPPNGNIAKISIYNRALSAAEVLQNYNALVGRFGGTSTGSIVTDRMVLNLDAGNTVSYPGTGTTWTDISLRKNNWTPNNLSVNSGGQVSISASTGGIPIYNTTDTYGAVKGTGTRTDSNSANLVLAIPMDGANNGTTFTDESATIKGSGTAKTITVNGNSKTLTAQSKFYGSSGFFDGATPTLLLVSSSTDFAFGTGAYTIEAWIYPTAYASAQGSIFDSGNASGALDFFLTSTGALGIGIYGTGNTFVTSASAVSLNQWTHVTITRSSTSASSARIYVNGVLASTGTDSTNWTVSTTPSIGGINIATYSFLGYIQDFRIYKGVAKYTSNFTPPSATQNTTVAAGCDSLTDTPTSYGTDTGAGGEVRGNYATLNPLSTLTTVTLANGNLDYSSTTTSRTAIATIGVSSGTWYWEVATTAGTTETQVGVYGTSASTLFSLTANSTVYGIRFNADTGALDRTSDGVTFTSIATGLTSGPYFPYFNNNGTTSKVVSANFGQRPFAYAAPSGFKALCDTNLPTPTIAKGSSVFDAKLYTGTGSTQTISGLGFSPDLVWLKNRVNNEASHVLNDTNRGANKRLSSNLTAAEDPNSLYGYLSAFTSDGFTLTPGSSGADLVCQNTISYAAWAWDAGSSTVTNTAGSITSQVRANASAGFSVVTYTGTGANATAGHDLGVALSMVIVKRRDTTSNWQVRHVSIAAANSIQLNATTASAAATTVWNSTAPSSTVFSIGTSTDVNATAGTYVAYCFAPVTGYSAFGSYTGNGSADGPFVYLGFRPAFLMMKRTDTTSNWTILDTKRLGYNADNDAQYPNLTAVDGTADLVDITSNGFKLRSTNADCNASGGTYIYAAFAENPFQFARAR